MTPARRLYVLVLGLGGALAGCDAAPHSQAVRSTHAILDGETDTSHPGVVAIASAFESLTGFLIAPDLVLTARHGIGEVVNSRSPCVDENGGPIAEPGPMFAASKFRVYTNGDVATNPGTPLRVEEVLVPKDVVGLCGNDVALLRLKGSVDPAILFVPRLDGPPVVDEAVTVVGYGAAQGGTDTSSGVRRWRQDAKVTALGPQLPRYLASEWTISEGPCAGDSGSPAFGAADGRVIGVMSRGNKNTCADMIYERIDTHAAWLRDAAAASYERAGIEAPPWVEPASALDGGSGDAPPPESAGCRVIETGERGAEVVVRLVIVCVVLALIRGGRRLHCGS